MPARISESVKRNVIQEYLKGTGRDENASKNGISEGGVTNIINEFKEGLGQPTADEIRELAVLLRKLGITAPQCVSGFRIAVMLQKLGIDEQNFGLFTSEIYNQCRELDLRPDKISNYLKEMVELCQSMPFSQITEYVQDKKSEKEELEMEILSIADEKYFLEQEVNEKKALLSDLDTFHKLKIQLEKFGMPVDDIGRLAKVMQGFHKYNYGVQRLFSLISDLDSACTLQATLENQVKLLHMKLSELKGECEYWDGLAATSRQKASILEELEEMGFGIMRLRLLRNTIKEIAAENKMTENVAAEHFFSDIVENYDMKIGYQFQIKETVAELNSLEIALSYRRKVAKSLGKLASMGFEDKDILNLATILEACSIYEEPLVRDLKEYVTLKILIEQLTQQAKELKSEIASLEAEGSRLANKNTKITDNQDRDLLLRWERIRLDATMVVTAQKVRDNLQHGSAVQRFWT